VFCAHRHVVTNRVRVQANAFFIEQSF